MANISKRIVEFIKARPGIHKRLTPLADNYLGLAGYRKIGLR
jgi:hypothetical protein